MEYKNISGTPLSVPTVKGHVRVLENATVLTAKKFAQPLVEAQLLEPLPVKQPPQKSTPKGE
jgi:hypothetical protein